MINSDDKRLVQYRVDQVCTKGWQVMAGRMAVFRGTGQNEQVKMDWRPITQVYPVRREAEFLMCCERLMTVLRQQGGL